MNKNNKKIHIFFIYSVIIIFLKNNYNAINKKTELIKDIFIFVHGTWRYSFFSLLFNNLQKSLIKERWNEIGNKIAEQKGLIDITNIDDSTQYLKREKIVISYKRNNNQAFPHSKYFKFNWDAFLSEESRNQAGINLAKELIIIKEKFPLAKIHLVGYSHGGNVALNTIKYFSSKNKNIVIDELILLATPIGKQTELLANKKNKNNKYFFKKIFCLYSLGDLTQIKDFLFNFPLCHRFLKIRKKNVFNIECKYTDYNNKENKEINYLPNHKDFWILYPKKLFMGKKFHIFPIIHYLNEIIYSINEKMERHYQINKMHRLPLYKELKKNYEK